MNFKNLSILLAFACVVPAYADETTETQVPQEEKRNYALEDMCNTKMAFAKMAMVGGALAGIATGLGGTAGVTAASIAKGCAVFAMPAGLYAYQSNEYKNMFDEKTYERICDTEDKTFFFTMSALTAPLAILLPYAALQLSGHFGIGIGQLIGTGIGKIAAAIGTSGTTAGVAAVSAVSLIPTILATQDAEFQKQPMPDKAYNFIGKCCKNLAYAWAITAAGAYAYYTVVTA